ncbi:hypothetical protein CDAR_533831 [Caerostris darwini]|uniref:Uncharacterized protein n=1 Tax=Caerostris darwini TaxID=1538125 RepID=A0AAV4SAK0_9ARAC|nr:hypothetical protein CDAR_533831 [Caerostris darwini]
MKGWLIAGAKDGNRQIHAGKTRFQVLGSDICVLLDFVLGRGLRAEVPKTLHFDEPQALQISALPEIQSLLVPSVQKLGLVDSP